MLRRPAVRLWLAGNGVALAGLGHWWIQRSETWLPWLRERLPDSVLGFLSALSPSDAATGAGVLLVMLGALCLALSCPPRTEEAAPVPPALPSRWPASLWMGLLALAVLAVGSALVAPPPIWLWAACLFAPGLALARERRHPALAPQAESAVARWEWAGVAFILTGAAVLLLWDLDGLAWAGTADEVHFYRIARELLRGEALSPPLSGEGLWRYHPMLAHYWQAAWMWLLGPTQFAWRFSSVMAFLGGLPGFYLFVRTWWDRRTALLALLWLSSAPAALTFAHLGYNNIHPVGLLCAALGCLAWAYRSHRLLAYHAAGVVAGMGCYTFLTARLVPLCLILWTVLVIGRDRPAGALRTLLLGILLASWPALLELPAALEQMLPHLFFTADVASSPALAPGGVRESASSTLHLIRHAGLTWISPAASGPGTHFVPTPHSNPLISTLALAGIFGQLSAARRGRTARALLICWVLVAFVTGAISQYDIPPITRTVLLEPFFALFAALAGERLLATFLPTRPDRLRPGLTAVTVVAALGACWSVCIFLSATQARAHVFGDGTMAELIRLARQRPPGARLLFVQGNDTQMVAADLWLEAFGQANAIYLGGREPKRRGAKMVSLQQIPAQVAQLEAPCLIVYDLRHPAQIALLREAVQTRFSLPEPRWQESAPGQSHSLHFLEVKAGK